MSSRALIIGDSHVGCMKQGYDQLCNEEEVSQAVELTFASLGSGPLLIDRFFEVNPDGIEILTPAFRQNWGPMLPLRPDAAIGFCSNFAVGRIANGLLREGFALQGVEGELQPISSALFREVVRNGLSFVLQFLEELLRRGVPVFVVEGPGLFLQHRAFAEFDREVVATMYQAHRNVVLEMLESVSIPIVAMPSVCVGGDGMMLPEYKAELTEDFVHGNDAFGRLMVRETIQFLSNWGGQVRLA